MNSDCHQQKTPQIACQAALERLLPITRAGCTHDALHPIARTTSNSNRLVPECIFRPGKIILSLTRVPYSSRLSAQNEYTRVQSSSSLERSRRDGWHGRAPSTPHLDKVSSQLHVPVFKYSNICNLENNTTKAYN